MPYTDQKDNNFDFSKANQRAKIITRVKLLTVVFGIRKTASFVQSTYDLALLEFQLKATVLQADLKDQKNQALLRKKILQTKISRTLI